VPAVCGSSGADAGGSASASAPASQVVADGRSSLGAPLLCTSYACRAALLASPQSLPSSTALTQHLLACALPQQPGDYELLDFVVAGLSPSTQDEWWPWVEQAFKDLGVDAASIVAQTWFPTQGNVQFYVSATAGLNASGLLTAAALGQVLDEQANPTWAALPGAAASTGQAAAPVRVLALRMSPVDVTKPPGDTAQDYLWWCKVVAVIGVVYTLLALLAHHFGPRWLPPLVLCWPEVCRGQGCLVYRVACCPFVLVYNSARIYCWLCCMSYVAALGHLSFCKTYFWHEFTDPDFPPNDHSIGNVTGDTASGVTSQSGNAWAKASAIAGESGQAPHLFQDRIEPADVLQGALGDCWLLAALASVAERPEVLEQAIVTKHVDPRGKYHFRFWNQIKGNAGTKWVDIIIDENIPVHPGTLKPKFARTHCNEMWVLLMEKAFAKMYGGYDRLDGGQMSWALTAITGNPPVTLQKSGPKAKWTSHKEELDDDLLFKLLLKMRRNGAFMCCAEIAPANKMGLIDGHAYSIIQLQTVRRSGLDTSFFRMVQVRNPHGQTEWQGAWSDKSKTWADFPYVRRELCGDADRTEDGTFWMQWEDFVQFWNEVQIVDCAVNIRTVAPPNYNETIGGPVLSCLVGCWEYWCCCLGLRRLYLGREPADDLKTMEEGMDAQVGWDQEGFFCNLLERHTAATDEYGGDGHNQDAHGAGGGGTAGGGHAGEEHEPSETSPLCAWTTTCIPSDKGRTRVTGRTLSRK